MFSSLLSVLLIVKYEDMIECENMENSQKIKFGTVVVVGRPNTGKSTLINAIMNQKVAITSPLPQTTRKISQVLYTDERGKFILTDTPGVFNKVSDEIGRKVNPQAGIALKKADVIVFVVDVSRPKNEEESKTLGLIRKSDAKKILVFNKIDKVEYGLSHKPEYLYLEDEFDSNLELSSGTGKHIKSLLDYIFSYLPEVETSECEETITMLGLDSGPKISMSSSEFVSELIREKAYLCLRREVPYSVNVEVGSIEDKNDVLLVRAKIFTNAERYKKMIIGSGGKKIKQIGQMARKELELFSQRKVYLELLVEIDRHWMERVEL